MIKKTKILISIGMIILGWILNAIAFTTTNGPTINSISLLLGLGFFISGLIFLIINLIGKNQ